MKMKGDFYGERGKMGAIRIMLVGMIGRIMWTKIENVHISLSDCALLGQILMPNTKPKSFIYWITPHCPAPKDFHRFWPK